jgi:hypothetical protein
MQNIPQPPLLRDQRKIDANHLDVLSIFHFVGAGLAVVGMLFLIVHFIVFRTFLSNPKMWENQKQAPPPPEFMAMLKWFYLIFALLLIASAVLNLLSGFFIRARKHRTFSIVVSAINCIHIPLGTALGVFTVIVLMRDSVRELYENAATGIK